MGHEIVWQVVHAHEQGLLLTGDAPQSTALDLIAVSLGWQWLACGTVGKRFIGAAMMLDQAACQLADVARPHGGQRILIVRGAVAGAVGLVRAAGQARVLGASEIDVADAGRRPAALPGVQWLHPLAPASQDREPKAAPVTQPLRSAA